MKIYRAMKWLNRIGAVASIGYLIWVSHENKQWLRNIEETDNTDQVGPVPLVDSPSRITKTEFIERPGLFGNIDPDVTRYSLTYETDDPDDQGLLAQVSRKEFEMMRDYSFHGMTVAGAKERCVELMSASFTFNGTPGF